MAGAACQVGGTLLGSELERVMVLSLELEMGEEAFGVLRPWISMSMK